MTPLANVEIVRSVTMRLSPGGDETIQFRPFASGLDTDYAERLSAYVASGLHEYPDVNQRTAAKIQDEITPQM